MPMSVLSPFSDRERVTANNIDSGKDKIIGNSKMIYDRKIPLVFEQMNDSNSNTTNTQMDMFYKQTKGKDRQ
jgi:hypothetical protein